MTWKMWSGTNSHGFCNMAPDRRYAELYGHDPVPVIVTEDPDGTFYGWMGFAHLHHPADEYPILIQPTKVLFDMQFTYGPDAEVTAECGRIVRLSVVAE